MCNILYEHTVICSIVNNWLQYIVCYVYEANIDKYQFGFRKDRRIVNNLFCYSQLRRSSAATIRALYVDLKADFDKLPRRLLWKVIELPTGSKKYPRANIVNSEIWFGVSVV